MLLGACRASLVFHYFLLKHTLLWPWHFTHNFLRLGFLNLNALKKKVFIPSVAFCTDDKVVTDMMESASSISNKLINASYIYSLCVAVVFNLAGSY